MPPRPPPSPPVLTVLSCIAALAAVWLATALDQATRALAGAVSGIPFRGFALSPDRGYTLLAQQDPAAGGAAALAFVALAGSLMVILVTSVLNAFAANMRGAGLFRGLMLAASLVGLLWIPTALAAGVFGGGNGPASELYRRLGEPQAGRWASLAMGVVLLVVLAGRVAARTIGTGRSWMRADGLEFRRRLVRAQAGWPGVIAVTALGLGVGWAPTPWIAAWAVALLVVFQLRTR